MVPKRCLLACAILLFVPPVSSYAQNTRATKRLISECFSYNFAKDEVPWIITDEERAAYYKLNNDVERDQFIDQFWIRRDPTPKTIENEFRDTYYQRILYANHHFRVEKEPGWLTQRGRIYVMYGTPDTIEQRTGTPEGTDSSVVLRKQCDEAKPFAGPYEVWLYKKIPSVDHPVTIAFADVCGTGDSLPIVDKADAGWLSHPPVPIYALECGGKYDPNKPPTGPVQIVCGEQAPEVHFKDLQEVVSHKIDFHMLAFQIGHSFEPATSRTVAWTITLTFSQSTLKWVATGNAKKSRVQLYGRITTLTGRFARSFERDVTFDSSSTTTNDLLQAEIPLYESPGLYRLDVAVKDVAGDVIGTYSKEVRVPDLGSCPE